MGMMRGGHLPPGRQQHQQHHCFPIRSCVNLQLIHASLVQANKPLNCHVPVVREATYILNFYYEGLL